MLHKRYCTVLSCLMTGATAYPALAQQAERVASTLEEVVVTAQRKSEQIQNVPIAITALTAGDLQNQRIETGANLAQAVPNMSFQPGAFAKPNFVIRGIGYQLVTSTGEAGVAVHVNDAPITLSRIAQGDFYDVERIEVLRGPQGTLYGRNATGGVINAITNKPTSNFDASLTAEGGNFGSYKANGFVNIPLVRDVLALRIAGNYKQRDGYQINIFNGDDVGNIKIWGSRVTFGFTPSDRFTGRLMWEHFDENDGGGANGGSTRSICKHDPGPTAIGTTSLTDSNPANATIAANESLGCAPASIYDPAVLTGVVNGVGDFGNRLGAAIGLVAGDTLSNNVGPSSRYGVNLDQDPYNNSGNDLAQLAMDIKVADQLTLSALATYSNDHVRNGAGGLRAANAFAGGRTVSSPQLFDGAPLAYWTNSTYNQLETHEYSGELRLQSSFDGAVNFSVGANYVHLDRLDNVMIFDNINKYYLTTFVGFIGGHDAPVDPYPVGLASGGHYYYQSVNPYHLRSTAAFGELYWSLSDTVKMTLGARYTDDKKTFDENNSAGNLLVSSVGNDFGYTFGPPQVVEFKEPTGRLNFDWNPKLSFTDSTHLYASLSRGYKGGGFNSPNLVPQGKYDPEFVNAVEIGAKNEMLNRSLVLNLSAFYYDYKGYQFSQAAVFGTVTSNIDARIHGLEFETVWEPVEKLRFNAQIGYLSTKIQPGASASSIDQYNLTGGDPTLSVMKTLTSDCLVNTANFARLIADIKAGVNTADPTKAAPTAASLANTSSSYCSATAPVHPEYNLFAGVPGDAGGARVSGVPLSIAGNRLPNVPTLTAAVGIQYGFSVGGSWQLTPRIDYRHQADMYTDLFNNEDNRVKSYDIVNATFTLDGLDHSLLIQAYVKNITDNDAITGAALGGGAILGNPRSITVADPRTFGISITKGF